MLTASGRPLCCTSARHLLCACLPRRSALTARSTLLFNMTRHSPRAVSVSAVPTAAASSSTFHPPSSRAVPLPSPPRPPRPPSPPSAVVWHSLCVPASELRCAVSLTNGQCFGWRRHPSRPEWSGVVGQHVLSLRQCDDDTLFAVHHPPTYCVSAVTALLRDYLFLDRCRLVDLYVEWSADERFRSVGARLPGMRLLRQEPLECLIAFICSSCNNIARITQMVDALRRKYGQWLCDTVVEAEWPGQGRSGSKHTEGGGQRAAVESFYAFPTLSQLATIPSSELRALGFGYRAEYVTGTAVEVQRRGGLEWLTEWRSPAVSTDAVVAALQELPGVGPKVAACVALFSLDRLDLIPVDTHVHQIALRDYGGLLSAEVRRSKSVNRKVHDSIAALFRGKFGEMAGWAHSVLFTAELPAFQHLMIDTAEVAAAQQVSRRQRKRERGGVRDVECASAVEVEEVVSASGAFVQSDQSRTVPDCVVVKGEEEFLVTEQRGETLRFPVVKRARIPRKPAVIVKRAQRSSASDQ